MRRFHRSCIALIIVVAAECVPPHATYTTAGTNGQPVQAYITVTNTAPDAADVYAYRFGQRFRIGFVPGISTAVLPVRQGLFAEGRAQLYVQLLDGKPGYLTDEVTIGEGGRGRAELRIVRALNESTLTPLPDTTPWSGGGSNP